LRLSIEGCVFVHIPQILYHWRRHMGSTSINPDSKPEAHEKGRRSVEDHLRAKYEGMFSHLESSTYQFVYSPRFKALSGKVSIIIPTKDRLDLLVPCIQSIVSLSTYQNLEVIIINNRSIEYETKVYLESLLCEGPMFKTFDFDFPFNWSAINNFGAKQASGEYFIFLNNDTRVVSEDWIERLGEFAQLADVGPVGPLLLYPDGTIQHAGVVVGMKGWADHVYKGESAMHKTSPYVSPLVTRDVLAVTGACMMISRHKFQSIGTFDEQFQICGSDVEFCIRSHKLGHHNLYIPTVKIEHHESKTRSSFVPDSDFKQSAMKYGSFRTEGDPFFNKNLSRNNLSPQPLWPDQN